jgi:hypothetical protein
MAGVMRIPWYATLFRSHKFADAVAEIAPLSLRYGATRYAVHRSRDDGYRIDQMLWFESKDDWYRYWDCPEMVEFRARYMGKYQVPVVYVWHEEIAAGELGPQVGVPEPALPAPNGGVDGHDGGRPARPNGDMPSPRPSVGA